MLKSLLFEGVYSVSASGRVMISETEPCASCKVSMTCDGRQEDTAGVVVTDESGAFLVASRCAPPASGNKSCVIAVIRSDERLCEEIKFTATFQLSQSTDIGTILCNLQRDPSKDLNDPKTAAEKK
jgi:hypothetical protein